MFFRFKNKYTNYTKRKIINLIDVDKINKFFVSHLFKFTKYLTLADFTYPIFNMIYYLLITYQFLLHIVQSI